MIIKASETQTKSEQRAFLNDRVQEVSRQQPEILTLRAKLLGIGGAEIVALPLTMGIDPFVPLLEKWGEVMEGRVTYRRMEPSQCHLNVARLWEERKKGRPVDRSRHRIRIERRRLVAWS
jgi:hypothetical protein